jgi:hypothetical protein
MYVFMFAYVNIIRIFFHVCFAHLVFLFLFLFFIFEHSYDILGARMLWKPKEARILTNFIDQPV